MTRRALLLLVALLGGCGDAPSGTDRCGGRCRGHEQCALTKIELTGPACYPSMSCTSYGFACVDPANVHIMSEDDSQQ